MLELGIERTCPCPRHSGRYRPQAFTRQTLANKRRCNTLHLVYGVGVTVIVFHCDLLHIAANLPWADFAICAAN